MPTQTINTEGASRGMAAYLNYSVIWNRYCNECTIDQTRATAKRLRAIKF